MKAIARKHLRVGQWYLGLGRGSSVAMWNGKTFMFFSEKFGQMVQKECSYAGEESGCFCPLEEILQDKYPGIHHGSLAAQLKALK